ncbi:MAG: hypothetical protein F6K26_34125 [Moorea sp. SIO2I5]|nr:hypothetical protein [Moorena sp. SIO2I5]
MPCYGLSLWVVRYGADYPNPGYEAKNQGKSAPKAPLALSPSPARLSSLKEKPRVLVRLFYNKESTFKGQGR